MFISRERRGRDRFLWAKLACLVLGGVLGLIGMRRESVLLVNLAIAVILVGFGLRFVPQKTEQSDVEDLVANGETPAPDTHHSTQL
jgi:membrane protein implicated in regulation of membrane protease activity